MRSRGGSTELRSLGTTALVAVTDVDSLLRARRLLERELAAIDRTCSRFRIDSELRRLAGAGGRRVAVSPLLSEALETALRAARLTDGLVTPTIGRSLVLAGYDRDLGALRPSWKAARFTIAPDWRLLRLDPERRTVQVPNGVELDLGATAKALAADRAASAIASALGSGVLVSLGGDMRVAGKPPEGGWHVFVDDRHDTETAAGCRLQLTNGALATSSTTGRRWRRGGGELHHILDPRTGVPAQGPWRTVSVAAASCVDANVASTAAILLGRRAIDWLERRGLPSRLVSHDGSVATVAGWPDEAEVDAAVVR